ncbi:ABC transporter permease [Candidatus Nanogingivalis gingivitcus]|uniref:ABC transporter permease YknZ n=1 Tax=Candidatus Nanogingivalis gingivitcus TaxID=2171992 RepID=A0ABY0FHN7_9BACT|nr:ABC transporter permease [Candidatus Nanogingivalis gingivitcus]RYC72485.1 putative ABC transporter permease YknZ [Candidatus Nanogingivalis gingivitcus]
MMKIRLIRMHIENAIESLRANRMRTFLTILGVVIGISSIVVIFALSGGANSIIQDQIKSGGETIAVVRPKDISSSNKSIINSVATSQNFLQSSLREDDFRNISKIKNIIATAPLASFNSKIKGDDKEITTNILASTPNLDQITGIKVAKGEFITNSSNARTAVIGYQTAVSLFGSPHALGKYISIKGENFLIIGILEKQSSIVNFSNIDFDNTIILNYDEVKNIMGSSPQIQQINIKFNTINNSDIVQHNIEEVMHNSHKGEIDYEILIGKNITHSSSDLISMGSAILALVASISLIVGGIGIMNIMLVNVSERTREIGIRKALGANNNQILLQFLIESLIISSVGGFFGYLLGYSFSFTVSIFLPVLPVISWQIMVLAAGLSIIIGIIFGMYPAIRAARKDPIESLRYYN